jgi:thioredoxin 1
MVTKSGGRLIASIEQFDQEVLKNESSDNEPPLDPKLPVLVLFSAPWCGPCRLTNPVVKEIMKQYQNKIEVVEISTDDLPEVASDAGVLSIPTIQLYYEGKVLDTIVGCVAKNVLARSVDKVLEDLGMLDDQV